MKAVFDVAAACDPASEIEAPNLIPNTRLRPADILTGALGHGSHALDVGICSPDAVGAGDDCVDTMYRGRAAPYEPHLDTLVRQHITYQPLIWSSYGRPHSQTTSILRTLTTRLTRRRGGHGGEWRYQRIRATIGVELMRRAVACVRSCYTAKHGAAALHVV